MLTAEEILKKAEKRLKNRIQTKTTIASTCVQDRPWYQGESLPDSFLVEATRENFSKTIGTESNSNEKEIIDTSTNSNVSLKDENIANNGTQTSEIQLTVKGIQPEFKLSTSPIQMDHKHKTNQGQTRDNLGTNQGQTRDNLGTNQGQTRDNPDTQPETTFETRDNPKTTFSTLVGLQRSMALFVYAECKANRSEITKGLSLEYMAKILNCPSSSIKKTAQRLIQKKIITRVYVKNGPGGWVTYSIPNLVFQELLLDEKTRDNPETILRYCSKFEHNPKTQPETNLTSSSSYINNKNTTTRTFLPEDWKNINLDFLQSINFSESHLRQLYAKNITTPEIIQESIKHFAYGLLHNPKTKQYSDPVNVLMGVLGKGGSWVESNYKSPKEIAMQELIERKKAEIERLDTLEKNAYEMALNDWKKHLSQEEINTITSVGDQMTPIHVQIRLHFKAHIWPAKKKEYLVE
jgi:hypothetical protein